MMWTVDTCILMCANGGQRRTEDSRNFLSHVFLSGGIALSEEVLKEYSKKALADKKGFAAIWFSRMSRAETVSNFFDPEGESCAALRSALASPPVEVRRFDDDDVPFVVLCFRTADRHLVSGDIGEGDYGPALTSWLREAYNICFHDLSGDEPYHVARHECSALE